MVDAPQSYFVMDPGRTMGFAHCLVGGANLKHGTWRFKSANPGEAYAEFVTFLKRTLVSLPDPLVAIELMTIVDHPDARGRSQIDAQQVMFSSGWPTHAQTLCFSMGLRPPVFIAISSWRSKTHGKTRSPKGMTKQNEKAKFFKQCAKDYCDANGWSYNTDDEAEALCMLDAIRMEHEPEHAFDKGRAYRQEDMFA